MKLLNFNSTGSHSKINRLTCLLILYFGFVNLSCGQNVFQKGYAMNNSDLKLFAGLQTADGNIAVAANVSPTDRRFLCLAKMTMNGDTIWAKTYKSLDRFKCNALIQSSDNGFVIAGTSFDTIIGDARFLLIKTDPNGNIVWTKTHNSSDMTEEIFTIKETPGGDYFFAGVNFVGKTDAMGNLIWAKRLSGGNVQVRIYALDNTSDGGVALAGTIDTLDPQQQYSKPIYAYLLKMNASGNVRWAKSYRSLSNVREEFRTVEQTSDKGFSLAGVTFVSVGPIAAVNCTYLVKTDSLGDLVWTKKFDSLGHDNTKAARQTADGGYIVTGSTTGMAGNGLWTTNTFLIKTDPNGIITWCKYYGLVGNSLDESVSMFIANDGGYLVPGITTSNLGYPNMLYLLRTDASGNTSCNGFNWQLHDSVYISFSNPVN